MNRSKFIFLKFFAFILAGLFLSTIASKLVSAQAQSLQVAGISVSRNGMEIVSNLKDFNLQLDSNPILPPGLKQSENPFSGRAILGEDDRVPMTSNQYPWSAIGRIEGLKANGEPYICSGTLIEADVVLTNAHCVIDRKTHQLSQVVQFVPNMINGSRIDVGKAIALAYGTNFEDIRPNQLSPDDWALVQLDLPLGLKYGTLKWQPLDSITLFFHPKQFALIGYHGDFPPNNPGNTAGVHLSCSIFQEESEFLLHDCDTAGGSSGGPIIGIIENEFRIVGLNVGEARFLNGEALNYAVKITRLVNRLTK